MKPLVSICIPTYNGAKYIQECLDSARAQNFTDFEVLIVDDRSQDSTFSIAQAYAAGDRRFRVIRNEHNLGLVGNWNRCVELAQGEWIKFLFQDDLLAPECLEQMLAASKPEIPIICCRRNFIFESGTLESARQFYLTHATLGSLFSNQTEISASNYCQATLEHIGINLVGEPTSVMLHKSTFEQFGTFNPNLIHCCDFEFWTRVAIHTGIIYIPQTLATFRVHGSSTTASNQANRKYHAWELDKLAILHDILFNPIYEPLRVAATHHRPRVNLASVFADKAYDARRIAERAAANSVNPNPRLLAEWKSFLKLYPNTLSFSKRSILKRIVMHCLYRSIEIQRQVEALLKLKFARTE